MYSNNYNFVTINENFDSPRLSRYVLDKEIIDYAEWLVQNLQIA